MRLSDCCHTVVSSAPAEEVEASEGPGFQDLHSDSDGSFRSIGAASSDAAESTSPALLMSKLVTSGNLDVPSLLFRGVSLRQTLRHGGRHWLNPGRQELFEMSSPVEKFDFFISHT